MIDHDGEEVASVVDWVEMVIDGVSVIVLMMGSGTEGHEAEG